MLENLSALGGGLWLADLQTGIRSLGDLPAGDELQRWRKTQVVATTIQYRSVFTKVPITRYGTQRAVHSSGY